MGAKIGFFKLPNKEIDQHPRLRGEIFKTSSNKKFKD